MKTLFEYPNYIVKQLGSEDEVPLQALLAKCSDYFELATGLPPSASSAYSLLTVYPEGKTSDDKLVIGFFTEGQNLIGVMDLIRDYPAQADWWIGLLLLDPAYRCRGLGQQIYNAFEKWAAQNDAHRVCLGVVEQNRGAYRFWRKAGFAALEFQSESRVWTKEHIIMSRSLSRS